MNRIAKRRAIYVAARPPLNKPCGRICETPRLMASASAANNPSAPTLDFYCASGKLVVAVDGPIHAHQRDYDRERDAFIAAHGLRVLRVTNDAVLTTIDHVLTSIRRELATPP